MLGMPLTRSRWAAAGCTLLPGTGGSDRRKRSATMANTLKDKKVIILGGSSGIGLATARAAADEGATVVVTSSRKEKVIAAIASIGGRATGEVADLTDEAQTRALLERIGAVDHLVFTAGES